MKTYEITIALPFTYTVEAKNAYEAEREAERMATQEIERGDELGKREFTVKDVRLLNDK